MDVKKKVKELLAKSFELIEEARTATLEGDLELADSKNKEAQGYIAKAEALKKSLDLESAGASLQIEEEEVEPEPEPVVAKTHRMPFDTDDTPPDNGKEDSVAKSVHILRYGDPDAAVGAVIKGLYGSMDNYYEGRERQRDSFVKYVRTGDRFLNAKELASLKTIIPMPETLKNEIVLGSSVSDIKAQTLVEGLGDLGGYLVPEDYRLEVIKRLMGATVVRGRARVISTMRDAAEWPKLLGGNSLYTSAARVTWVEETPADENASKTNPTFGMTKVPVYTAMARADLSRNLLEDSAFNLLDVLADLFAEAMAIDEDARFLTGDGAGVPKGVLGNRSGANQTPETGIENAVTGNATAVTADGMVDLVYNLHAQYRSNAVLVGSRTTHRDLRKLKDGNGQYLWQPGMTQGEPPTLLGYSFLESENMPAIGANNYPVIFGDFRGYLIVDRIGMSIERVVDTDTIGTNTVALFARRRLGGQVIEPWRFQTLKVATS